MNYWQFIVFFVGTVALVSASLEMEDGSLPSEENVATPDILKEAEGDKQTEANSGIVFNTMQIPSKIEKSRAQFIHDIMKKDEQRLKYIAARVESAKSENSKTQSPKLTGLKVVNNETEIQQGSKNKEQL